MFRKDGFSAFTWNFYKNDKNIYNTFHFLFKFQFFLKYKFSAPFSLVKNAYHIHVRWGTPQNFFLAFIDGLQKQLFIKH